MSPPPSTFHNNNNNTTVTWRQRPRVSPVSYLLVISIFILTTAAFIIGIVALVRTTSSQEAPSSSYEEGARFCIRADGTSHNGPIRPGPGDGDGMMWGTLTFYREKDRKFKPTNGCDVEWHFSFSNIAMPLTGLHVHGPLSAASPDTADVFMFLNAECAVDDAVHKNKFPVSNVARKFYYSCSAIAGSTNIHCDKLHQILSKPPAYYISLKNAEFPQGAVGAYLSNRC